MVESARKYVLAEVSLHIVEASIPVNVEKNFRAWGVKLSVVSGTCNSMNYQTTFFLNVDNRVSFASREFDHTNVAGLTTAGREKYCAVERHEQVAASVLWDSKTCYLCKAEAGVAVASVNLFAGFYFFWILFTFVIV